MSISQNFPNTRPSLNLNFAKSQKLDPRITFTRTSSATRVNSDGLIETVPANSPRFDFDPVTGECLGLLVEEQRTNLLRYSQDWFGTVYGSITINQWNFFGTGLVTQNQMGLDGVTNSAVLVEDNDTAGDQAFLRQRISVSPTGTSPYCYSFYAKRVGNESFFDFYCFFNPTTKGTAYRYFWDTDTINIGGADGGGNAPVAYGRIPCGNGWYRFWMAVIDASGGTNTETEWRLYPSGRLAGPTGSIIIYGPQIEVGSFPTSYIPTTSSTVTRTPDNASITGSNFSDFYNPSEGTLKVNWKTYTPNYLDYNNLRSSIASLNGGTALRGYYLDYLKSDGRLTFGSRDNTNTQVSEIGSHNKGDQVISTLSYSQSLDNILGLSSADTTIVNNALYEFDNNTLILGNYVISGSASQSQYLNGTISQLTYYPARLTNTQLQTLTK